MCLYDERVLSYINVWILPEWNRDSTVWLEFNEITWILDYLLPKNGSNFKVEREEEEEEDEETKKFAISFHAVSQCSIQHESAERIV